MTSSIATRQNAATRVANYSREKPLKRQNVTKQKAEDPFIQMLCFNLEE